MSRFAIDPRWLVYLPPTMAPTATSKLPDALEHPAEAFAEFRAAGVARGRLRGEAHGLARDRGRLPRGRRSERFGIEGIGALYTRTGSPVPGRQRARAGAHPRRGHAAPACGRSSRPDWLVLDCELLPWSAKAMELIRRQYAAVGAAASAALTATTAVLEQATARGLADAQELLDTTRDRLHPRRALPRRLPRATCGTSTASRTCGSRRSTSSPPSRAPSPAATTAGTSSTATRSSPPTRTGSAAPTGASSTSPTPRPRRRRPRGGRR